MYASIEYMCILYRHVPEAVSGVVGEVGERGLVDVEDPHLLAVAGELQALDVGDSLVNDNLGIAAVVTAEHVVPDVALAAGGDRLPVTHVVRLHTQPPAVTCHAGAAPLEATGGHKKSHGGEQEQHLRSHCHFYLLVLPEERCYTESVGWLARYIGREKLHRSYSTVCVTVSFSLFFEKEKKKPGLHIYMDAHSHQ